MTRKQQAGGKDEPGATASGLTKDDESLESQLKNVDINKVYHIYTFITVHAVFVVFFLFIDNQ